MLKEIKDCADSRDIKGLRYIFVDSLDVDPTFDTYREDYLYCKQIDGMFDQYEELSPMIDDQTQWTTTYWDQLKIDLMANFSEERFEHMIEVARVVYADKVSRLLTERQERANTKIKEESEEKTNDRTNILNKQDSSITENKKSKLNTEDEENERIERIKREYEARYELDAEKERAEREIRERTIAEKKSRTTQEFERNGNSLKKAIGIVLIVAIIVIIVLLFIYWCNPVKKAEPESQRSTTISMKTKQS